MQCNINVLKHFEIKLYKKIKTKRVIWIDVVQVLI
jgi:hypothetical protein